MAGAQGISKPSVANKYNYGTGGVQEEDEFEERTGSRKLGSR